MTQSPTSKPVDCVLVANRGAIAVRIIRTLKAMNIRAIAVYAEADRDSLHVRSADLACSLGPGGATQTYLDYAKLIAIALREGAQSIHPGYGFLSENVEFVQACERNNIIFLGPRDEHIAAFGLKHKARALAEKAKVPLLPGSGILSSVDDALAQAASLGFPVMLKSTAGGGGIGMQLCNEPSELADAWASVSRLSENNFANADLFLEKFVAKARHIEVQIFGDGEGQVIAIGERDCSAQRRHQKVVEEAPAPNLSNDARSTLHNLAIDLTASVNYRSVGTVEFIYDTQSDQFYFLEVNTRLQVEHGVTEYVYNIDLVAWMVRLANNELPALCELAQDLTPRGHAIQARLYAEDPHQHFQPSAGLLSHVSLTEIPTEHGRVDTWIESGVTVSPFFDPLLAKFISYAQTRSDAVNALKQALTDSELYGIETNVEYLNQLLERGPVHDGTCLTSTLETYTVTPNGIRIEAAGTFTTVQDLPGRIGYWDVGVPPSGPFDSLSFRLGNMLLNNDPDAAGLEMTVSGAQLRFLSDTFIVITGAAMKATLDDDQLPAWTVISVAKGQVLRIGKVSETGLRSYLLFAGGIQCPHVLGSRATFFDGRIGGHVGRALRTGDVLRLATGVSAKTGQSLVPEHQAPLTHHWSLRVIAGPQGAPEYFTQHYMDEFFSATWTVHYNSNRTGIRLRGPKPQWAREDGGEAGLHPSNIHDNAYAVGSIDFTGDMPVILGPDGPSLGGFVCPATIISADLWKVGQLAPGDTLSFIPISMASAIEALRRQEDHLDAINKTLKGAKQDSLPQIAGNGDTVFADQPIVDISLGMSRVSKPQTRDLVSVDGTQIALRPSGDSHVLVEYGEPVLDITLRFMVHKLMLQIQQSDVPGIITLTPGIRSLQIHYDNRQISYQVLCDQVMQLAQGLSHQADSTVPSRIVHLPLSWDDEQCQVAIEKYDQSVRPNAPWYPSNLEFIRRINGLDSIEAVRRIVFDASYLVLGLGDVYLGAPVATPLDPRHRLVTTKYNPARTWTAENCVGIGGSYLCIYGMEGPGGYQFVGRTLQMWNRYRQTSDFQKPWLLRFFDQIRFHPVSAEELHQIREDFPLGDYTLQIEESEFDLSEYQQLLADNKRSIDAFVQSRQAAFDAELDDWKRSGQLTFELDTELENASVSEIPDGMLAVESPVDGSVWQLNVCEGETVTSGQSLMLVESMKMEIDVSAPQDGIIHQILQTQGSVVSAGRPVLIMENKQP